MRVYFILLMLILSSYAVAEDELIKEVIELRGHEESFINLYKAGMIRQCKKNKSIKKCRKEIFKIPIKNVDLVLRKAYRDTFSDTELQELHEFYSSQPGKIVAVNELLKWRVVVGLIPETNFIPFSPEEYKIAENFKETEAGKKALIEGAILEENIKNNLMLLEY